jgi:GNAT superfamily N-acetyltransferase
VRVGSDQRVDVRRYREDDEGRTVELLRASLGGGPAGSRSHDFFRWKHLGNPFGPSLMLVAETGERIVGFRAFIRWRFTTGERDLLAVRAVDTATHPDFQGRGIFKTLTMAALDDLRGEADLVFNTPNEKSLPGYLKMGWRTVGTVPIRVRVRRPVRFARRVRTFREVSGSGGGSAPAVDAPPASETLGDAEAVSTLISRAGSIAGALATPRSVDYLRWRYGSAPSLDYRAVGNGDGLAIFRVRPRGQLWEATVSEIFVPEGDAGAARRLLRAVARTAAADHLTFSFPSGSALDRGVRRRTIRAPGGMTLVTRPLVPGLRPDAMQLSSWALSLGDLEVF